MTDPEIGSRIARWRRRRGLSQVTLAGLIGRSESWLFQVERGLRPVDSLVVLRELARVLRVDMEILAPPAARTTAASTTPVGPGLPQALLAPGVDGSTPVATAREVADLHTAYQDTRYSDALAGLPAAITSLQATSDPWVLTAGWTVVAKTLTKVGADDLALVAADRGRQVAYRTGDLADLGVAVYQVVCALLPTPRADVGESLGRVL